MLTSYHAHTASLVDRYCDVILVGDSLGNVMHGFETTVPVTLEMMILQGHAVMRGSKQSLVVVDMPFGSYEASKEQAFHSAARIMKETHCGAVKLEGGARMAETIGFLTERGIPVMAHIGPHPAIDQRTGLVPLAGQGRSRSAGTRRECERSDSERCDRGGAGRRILRRDRSRGRTCRPQNHPDDCDPHHRHRRQFGMRRPRCWFWKTCSASMRGCRKFVKKYGNIGSLIEAAIEGYATEVRSRAFPGPEHVYGGKPKG